MDTKSLERSLVAGARSPATNERKLLIGRLAIRRIQRAAIVTLWVVTIVFVLLRAIPGDPVMLLLLQETGPGGATPELIAEYEERLGLDGNLLQQYVRYIGQVATGELGESFHSKQPVLSIISRSLPITLGLLSITIVLSLLASIPLALFTALSKRRWVPYLFRGGTSVLLALPSYFVALLAVLGVAIGLQLAPIGGYEADFPSNLGYLWLPASVLALYLIPIWSRVTYSSLTSTLTEEFAETGVVRGVSRPLWTWRYLLRPSLAPTIALLGFTVGQLLSGAVIIEILFGLPGIGKELVDAVYRRDYAVVQGVVLVFGIVVVIVSFLGDLVNSRIDPRVRI